MFEHVVICHLWITSVDAGSSKVLSRLSAKNSEGHAAHT
jgi:hypothetical protein